LTLSHLPSLLTQLSYCSAAFSRLGLDFRCLLVSGGGLFSTAILSIVRRDFRAVVEKWENRLGSAYGASMSSSSRNASASTSRRAIGLAKLPSNWLVSPSAVDTPPPTSIEANLRRNWASTHTSPASRFISTTSSTHQCSTGCLQWASTCRSSR